MNTREILLCPWSPTNNCSSKGPNTPLGILTISEFEIPNTPCGNHTAGICNSGTSFLISANVL